MNGGDKLDADWRRLCTDLLVFGLAAGFALGCLATTVVAWWRPWR